MSGNDQYRRGDYWITDDRSGVRIRSSEARTEWTGAVVHEDDFEERHPQDYVRTIVDRQVPTGPIRPEPVPVLVGPLTTLVAAVALAGATSLTVDDTTRFEAGDRIKIMLDNNDSFRVVLQAVPDAETLTLTAPLPFATSVGMAVVDETAVADVDIG